VWKTTIEINESAIEVLLQIGFIRQVMDFEEWYIIRQLDLTLLDITNKILSERLSTLKINQNKAKENLKKGKTEEELHKNQIHMMIKEDEQNRESKWTYK